MEHCQRCGQVMYDGIHHMCPMISSGSEETQLMERQLDILANIMQQLVNLNKNIEEFNVQTGAILEVLSDLYGESRT